MSFNKQQFLTKGSHHTLIALAQAAHNLLATLEKWWGQTLDRGLLTLEGQIDCWIKPLQGNSSLQCHMEWITTPMVEGMNLFHFDMSENKNKEAPTQLN